MIKRFTFLLLLFFLCSYLVLSLGEVQVGFWDFFNLADLNRVQESVLKGLRLPKYITAISAGVALALSGLFLQSFFQNPLAGPFVLGIHSGASLFVAIYLLIVRQMGVVVQSVSISMGTVASSILGSVLVLMILLSLSRYFKSKSMLLIFGLLISYVSGGILNVLFSISEAGQIKDYVYWSFGSFNRVAGNEVFLFSSLVFAFTLFCLPQIKRLNVLMLGDNYAKSLGVSTEKIKIQLIVLASCLSGLVTAFCGPIAFIGIMTPHLAKFLFKSSDHKVLFPACLFIGAIVALLAEILSSGISGVSIPINSSLGIFGVPVIMLFLIKKLRGAQL